MTEAINVLTQIINHSEDLKPIVKDVIKIIDDFSPEVYSIFKKISFGLVDLQVEMILRFESHGFTREQAIDLTKEKISSINNSIKNSLNK